MLDDFDLLDDNQNEEPIVAKLNEVNSHLLAKEGQLSQDIIARDLVEHSISGPFFGDRTYYMDYPSCC